MKEIKAYIPRAALAPILDALRRAGARVVAIAEVHLAELGREPGSPRPETASAGGYALREVLRVEVVCADQDAERFAQAVLDAGECAARGDLLFVSDVLRGTRIGDLAPGEEVLARTI